MNLMTEQMHERRERILAATRDLLAERGYAAVTVRELASRSGVSVPTLYNRFGGKDALIAEAVQDHFHKFLEAVVSGEEGPGLDRLLSVVARCVEEVTRLSDYHHSLFGAFVREPATGSLHLTLATDLVAAFARELEAMSAAGHLAAWVDRPQLAGQITTACISASMAWVAGGLDDSRLRAFADQSVGLMLLGVCVGEAREKLERVLVEAQRVLAEPVAPGEVGDEATPRHSSAG